MQVYKFGGTSVGSPQLIKSVKDIIDDDIEKIVVLSANGKITDKLVNLSYSFQNRDLDSARLIQHEIKKYYLELFSGLFDTLFYSEKASTFLVGVFNQIDEIDIENYTREDHNWLLSRGEIISTNIFSLFLQENNIENAIVPSLEIIQKDIDEQINASQVAGRLNSFISNHDETGLFITQGFICSNYNGSVDNLGRGGSDYTASLLGQACNASVIQIWSDVDGFLNNDPGYIRNSKPLEYLSFDEAAELAYFGARVLHPTTLIPAKQSGIPVLLKNTHNPLSKGTVISDRIQSGEIKAVAAKDGIISITIHSGRMLMAYGFLAGVFRVFEKYKTPVDMVTTSEVSVAVTIDNASRLDKIIDELDKMGQVETTQNLSIVCIVGDNLTENQGNVSQIFSSLENIEIRMISYGAAKNSISILVDSHRKIRTLKALNNLLPHHKTKNFSHV